MKSKNVSIVSVAAVLVAVMTIWQFKDKLVFAEDFKKMSNQFEQLTIQQQELNSRMDKHLQIERIQLIQDLEEKLELLYIELRDNPSPSCRAKIEKIRAQLSVLYAQDQ